MSRSRTLLVVAAAAAVLAAGSVVAVVAAQRDDGGAGQDARPAARANPKLDVASTPVPPRVQALRKVAEVRAWAAEALKTPALEPNGTGDELGPYPSHLPPLSAGVKSDACDRTRLAPASDALKEGEVSVSYDADPDAQQFIIPPGLVQPLTCQFLWVSNRVTAGAPKGKPVLRFGPHAALKCGDTFVGPNSGDAQLRAAIAPFNVPPLASACLANLGDRATMWQVLTSFDELRLYRKCTGCDLSGIHLAQVRSLGSGATAGSSPDFGSGVQFLLTSFDHAVLESVDLTAALFAGVSMRGATLRDVDLDSAAAFGIDASPAEDGTVTQLIRTNLGDSVLEGVDLTDARIVSLGTTGKIEDGPGLVCARLRGVVALRELGVDLRDVVYLDEDNEKPECVDPLQGAVIDLDAVRLSVPGVRRYPIDADGAFVYVSPGTSGALTGAALAGLHLRRATLIGAAADLSSVNLATSDLSGSDFSHARFFPPHGAATAGANLSDALLVGASFAGAELQHAKLANADISKATFRDANLAGAVLSTTKAPSGRPDLSAAYAPGLQADQAKLPGAAFSRAHLHGARFDDADLTGAQFDEAVLNEANFTSATLHGVNLEAAMCLSCNFQSADLGPDGDTGSNLVGTFLYGAQMQSITNLKLANLSGAQGADENDPSAWSTVLGTHEQPSSGNAPPTKFPSGALTGGVSLCPDGARPDAVTDGAGGCDGHGAAKPIEAPACLSAGAFRCPPTTEAWPDRAIASPVGVARSAVADRWLVASSDGTVTVVEPSGSVSPPIALSVGGLTAVAGMADGRFALSTDTKLYAVSLDPSTLTVGTPEPLAAKGTFISISALSPDVLGGLLVADAGARRVWVVDAAGNLAPFAGADGQLQRPTGVAVDRFGDTYIADPDANRVWKVDPAGAMTTFAGTGTAGPAAGADGKPVTGRGPAVAFDHPSGVAVADIQSAAYATESPPFTVLVADTGNGVVRTLNSLGVVMGPFADPKRAAASGWGVDAPTSVSVDPGSRHVYAIDAKAGAIGLIDLAFRAASG